MVSRSSFRNLHFNNFKLITWLQIFIIAIAPNFIFYQTANATTVASEGWSVTKKLVQGATSFYEGTKNILINGKNYVATGTGKITPAAGQVSKMIVRTGAVLAVDLAIKALLGSVDYVMDPANNRVKYKVKCDQGGSCQTSQYMWKGYNNEYYFTAAAACMSYPNLPQGYTFAGAGSVGGQNGICIYSKPTGGTTTYNGYSAPRSLNPAYDPNANNEEKYLPYDSVAAQIISDAAAEKTEGKAYVSSVADTVLDSDEQRQIIPALELTQQLNNSQAIPTNGTGTGSIAPPTTIDPTTGEPVTPKPSDLTLNFPEFCGWAPVVCQAAQSAINFPGTVAEYWKKTDKWMTEEPTDTTDTKPEIKDLQLNFDDGDRVTFNQTCPQPQPIELTFMGVSQSASFSYEPLCNFMTMIRPFVIGSAYLIGAYIVMGLSRGNSE